MFYAIIKVHNVKTVQFSFKYIYVLQFTSAFSDKAREVRMNVDMKEFKI